FSFTSEPNVSVNVYATKLSQLDKRHILRGMLYKPPKLPRFVPVGALFCKSVPKSRRTRVPSTRSFTSIYQLPACSCIAKLQGVARLATLGMIVDVGVLASDVPKSNRTMLPLRLATNAIHCPLYF